MDHLSDPHGLRLRKIRVCLASLAVWGCIMAFSTTKANDSSSIQDSPTGLITTFAISQDRQSLAVGGNRGVAVVDVATFDARWFSPISSTVTSLAFSPDGAFLASVHVNSAVLLWDARTGTPIRVLIENGGTTSNMGSDVAFSPDGDLLTVYSQAMLHVWNIQATPPWSSPKSVDLPNVAFTWAPSGSKLATGKDIWDMSITPPLKLFSYINAFSDVSTTWSPDGTLSAFVAPNRAVVLWNVRDNAKVYEFPTEPDYLPTGIAFSPDGKRVALGISQSYNFATHQDQRNSVITLWTFGTDQSEQKTADAGHTIFHMAFSPDGALLASGSADGVVTIWDAVAVRVLGRLENARLPDTAYVTPHWVSGDKLLTFVKFENSVILWDATHFSILHGFAAPLEWQRTQGSKEEIENDWGYGVWSPDNRFYAACGFEGPGCVVDTEHGRSFEVAGSRRIMSFGGWSEDSRYAVFYFGNQYGNEEAFVFDTQAWNIVLSSSQGCLDLVMSDCPAPSVSDLLAPLGAVAMPTPTPPP